jgi:hypothetical protein
MLALAGVTHSVSAQVRLTSTDDLTRQADIVVVGKVAGVKAGWNKEKTRIFTTVTVEVDEMLKGKGGESTVTIQTPGGEVDGVGEVYSHTARFAKDEDVVVFAEKDKSGNLRVAGGSEGKIAIRKDESTGRRRVADGISIEEFKARVKNAVHVQETE